VWSPDGRYLACTSRVGGEDDADDEAEPGTSKPARVITTLKYRQDNEGFVYDRRSHIFVVPFIDGGTGDRAGTDDPADTGSGPSTAGAGGPNVRQVTDGDFDDTDPAWAPDGRHLAFVSARHASRDLDNAADVWLLDVSEAAPAPVRLTDTAGPVRQPAFSPDGRHLAYLGHPYPAESGRNLHLYTVPAAPAGASDGAPVPRCLTEGLDRTCSPFFATMRPLWLPDPEAQGNAGWVLFGVEDQGDVPVYRVRGDGAGTPERILGGARQITGLTATGDGSRLAFTAADPVSPAEVFVCDAGGGDERSLTDLNRAWKGAVTRSAPERFRYVRNGQTLDGWVMLPAGFRPGRRYPALLNIHGGPATQYGHTFFDEFQVQAGAGYVVIFTNPRGSQGYGEAFTRSITRDWGNDDYGDVMAGLDEALRRYECIDPQRLGVVGGSYGGYMTSWIVGHSDRFKAACSERALNDHASFFGTSDIGPVFAADYAGHLPWEHPGWYAERSPLTYARDITTPLLIVHAENDLRCPISQAEQLYVALKRLGRDVTMVRFPDEGHELSRSGKPRHRVERFRIILDWFARYLQP
jgi:dipeptidyl aminopeptidase/acylaminoacyl peptidase